MNSFHDVAEPMDSVLGGEFAAFRAVVCGDGKTRCPWAVATRGALADHDAQWAQPPRDAGEYFEGLSLELLDSGLARWSQSGRHAAWYAHMNGLRPDRVARLDEDDVEDLLLNPELIRNRAKIEAVVHNARVCEDWTLHDWRELMEQAGVPPVGPAPVSSVDLPDHTAQSQRLSTVFKERGIRLIGPVTAHRWLQRTGHAVAHVRGCFRLDDEDPRPLPFGTVESAGPE